MKRGARAYVCMTKNTREEKCTCIKLVRLILLVYFALHVDVSKRRTKGAFHIL